MTVAAVILAAGRSSRFEDGHKLLAEIEGVPIVRHVCMAVAASGVEDIILITSEVNGPVAVAAGEGRWRVVENPNASEGMSTSLRAGITNVSPDADGLLVALADMPGITTALVDALLKAFATDQNAIVFPQAPDGSRGHPTVWPKSLFTALKSVTGDAGGKQVLTEHKHLWHPVRSEIAGAFADIDTRADLRAFDTRHQATRRK